MTQHIFLLFIGRTGSTYLMQTFSCLENSGILCKFGEIFTTYDAILRTYKAEERIGLPSEKYRSFAIDTPNKYLEFIDESVTTGHLFSKIQIPFLLNKKKEIIDSCLSFKNCKIILVKRNLIDSYISHVKANKFKKWSGLDTTNKKITIDLSDFFAYQQRMERLYIRIRGLLEGKKYITIDYDEIHSLPTDREKANLLINRLNLLGLKMQLDEDKFKKMDFLAKQDKNEKLKDKITNHASFIHQIKLKGLRRLLKNSHT